MPLSDGSAEASHRLPRRAWKGMAEFPHGRIACLSLIFLAFVMALVGLAWLGLLVGVAGLVLAMPTNDGYVYQVCGDILLSAAMKRKRRFVYTADFPNRFTKLDDDDDPLEPTIDLALQAMEVSLPGSAERGIWAFIHNRSKDTDTCVITVDGWGRAAFADPDVVASLNNEAALLIAEIMHTNEVTISRFFMRRPVDPHPHAAYLEENLHKDFLAAESGSDVLLRSNLSQAYSQAMDDGAQVMLGFAVTAKRARKINVVKRREDPSAITSSQLQAMPVVKVAALLIEGLQNLGVNGVEPLGLTDLATFLRYGYDVGPGLAAFNEALLHDKRRFADDSSYQFADSDIARMGVWPTEVNPRYRETLMDDSFVRSILITGYKRRNVLSTFFQELLFLDSIWYTLSFTARKSSSRGTETVLREQRLSGQFRQRQTHRLTDPEAEDRFSTATQEHYELYAYEGLAIGFNVTFTVVAESIEALNAAEAEVQRVCRRLKLKAKPVRRRARQLPAYFDALGIELDEEGM